jgi:hypothetical protein
VHARAAGAGPWGLAQPRTGPVDVADPVTADDLVAPRLGRCRRFAHAWALSQAMQQALRRWLAEEETR